MQATDKTTFEKYPRITSWIETCKADIPGKHYLTFLFGLISLIILCNFNLDYKEANQEGADMFGQWAAGALAKLG